MKSRTSFFNLTVLKKNITRFAPAWALYSIGLLMVLFIMIDYDFAYYAENLVDAFPVFTFINFFYAPICALLLFGDLYNSRMCNALHAMPLRRETWFATNVLTGVLFSLVPNTVLTLISFPLVNGMLEIPLLFLAGITLQYLFFFGIAVLASFCVGNRFAMALVYIILNGFSIILYWLVDTLYSGVLYGVVIQEMQFATFSPLVKMLQFEYLNILSQHYWRIEDGWGYLGICAGIGILATALSLQLYRNRQLECAGDFISLRRLAPVFLVIYTLCGAACCHAFFSLFIGEDSYLFLFIGLVIGFFTGKMLLERTVRIFRKKAFLSFGILVLVFCASLLAVRLDVLGIVRWVPNSSAVEGILLNTSGSQYYSNTKAQITDPAMIADIIQIHKHGIRDRNAQYDGKNDVRAFITYHMKNGAKRQRVYYINHSSDAGHSLRTYMSSPEVVLGGVYTGELKPSEIMIFDLRITDPEDIRSFLDAVIADCEAVNLGQDWCYTEHSTYTFWIEILCDTNTDLNTYQSIRASSDAEHVVAWLSSHEEYAGQWAKTLEEYAK